MPDIRIVLGDGPVTGKNAAGRRIEDAETLPFGLIMPEFRRFPLLQLVAGKVGEHHPRVLGMGDSVDDGVENTRFESVEIAALYEIHDPLQVTVRL